MKRTSWTERRSSRKFKDLKGSRGFGKHERSLRILMDFIARSAPNQSLKIVYVSRAYTVVLTAKKTMND